jgi:hypothetical protein
VLVESLEEAGPVSPSRIVARVLKSQLLYAKKRPGPWLPRGRESVRPA